MTAYYNENDPYAAQWLRNLIAAGHIAPGEVDERSIADVKPDDLAGYTQCHFFAGIGVWSYAMRLAGWPDDRPVWTGSCPCQPFSAAGKRGGATDERHLWPHWFHLIESAKPKDVPVFGEQVASKDGLAWLDLVHADLEGAGHSVGAIDLCAAGVGAPHIRQRLFFVAESASGGREPRQGDDGVPAARCGEGKQRVSGGADCVGELADANGRDASAEGLQRGREHGQQPKDGGAGVALGDTHDAGSQGRRVSGADRERVGAGERAVGEAGAAGEKTGCNLSADCGKTGHSLSAKHATIGFWRECSWLPCIDGKARPVEPGTFPLAHGAPARVGRLRAYGNAIVAPVAVEFIRAYLAAHAD